MLGIHKRTVLLIVLLFSFIPHLLFAQELYQDVKGIWLSKILEVTNERIVEIPGTLVQTPVQTLKVEILNGEQAGTIVSFENDYIQLEAGDRFYLNYLKTINDQEFYTVHGVDRTKVLFFAVLLFVLATVWFGGKQGVKSLLSLVGSMFVILYVLVPQLVAGVSPIPLSIVVASAVLFFAIFFTHGFNRRSLIAFTGTVIAVGITGILAYILVDTARFTGFAADESIYLNLNTGGQLNFVGLLLAGIIIGSLGVLDDIAITQVAVVRELYATGVEYTKKEIYQRAIRVGREHVGALVNTLVLAYTGAALPLLLLFSLSESSVMQIVNQEIFSAEIIRSLIGSIGLILTVPITTLLAVYFLHNQDNSGEEFHTHIH